MTAPAGLSGGTGIITHEPIVAKNFYLELPGETTIILQSVGAINVEMEIAQTTQIGKSGMPEHVKTVGKSAGITPEIEMVRMAPHKPLQDPIWVWLIGIRDKGFTNRTSQRKNIVLHMFASNGKTEVASFTMFNAWPFKIATDGVDVTSSEAMKETITFCCERVTRTK